MQLQAFDGPRPTVPTNVGGTLLFTADDSHTGPAVWKSDGRRGGTVPIGPLPNDPMYIYSPLVCMVSDDVFFVAQDAAHGAGRVRRFPFSA